MVVYQKTIKLRFIVEKKNGTVPKRLKFLNKHDYRTQIYHEKKQTKKTHDTMGKKVWCYGKKLWYFDLLWKNYGTIPKTIVL